MSWDGNRLSPPLILKLALLCCPQWLMRVTMADVPVVGAPTTIAASCRPVVQGWMPPLIGLATGQVSLYSVPVLAWACFFVVLLAFAC
jgi:hypothetical protein